MQKAMANSDIETNITDPVISKCEFFADVQVWPLHKDLNPELWLTNFQSHEREHALALLNSFLYFNAYQIKQLFNVGFQRLSCLLMRNGEPFINTQAAWRDFFDTCIITRVTGEAPSDTDSAFHFARMARQVLNVDEDRILSPESTLSSLLNKTPSAVIFVDDFVGSGEQFIKTWNREVNISGSLVSFSKIAAIIGSQFIYCPIICTEYGANRITASCPQAILSPTHFLGGEYSALTKDSILWPSHLKDSAVDFIRNASVRAGIPEPDWKGFHALGLAIAFEHSVPDATLPFFYWNRNKWHPLILRT
jgi:hypothetical protein